MYYDDDNLYIFISEGNLSSTAVAAISALTLLCCVLFCLFVECYIYKIYGIFFFQLNEKRIEGIKKETNNTSKTHSAKQPSVPNRSQMNTKLAKCFWYCINAVILHITYTMPRQPDTTQLHTLRLYIFWMYFYIHYV